MLLFFISGNFSLKSRNSESIKEQVLSNIFVYMEGEST